MSTGAAALDVELTGYQRLVQDRLAAVRGRVRRMLLVEGLAWTLGAMALVIFGTLLLDWLFRPERTVRLWSLPILMLAIGVLAWWYLWAPLRASLDDLLLAVTLDRRQAGLGQQVAAVLQLPTLLVREPHTSPALVRAAVAEQAERLSQVDLVGLLNRRRSGWMAAAAATALALPSLAAVWQPSIARLWMQRWLLASPIRWPQANYLTVLDLSADGRLITPKSEPMLLRISTKPKFEPTPEGWRITGRAGVFAEPNAAEPARVDPDAVRLQLRTVSGQVTFASCVRLRADLFQYELSAVTEPLEVAISGGDDWFGPVRVVPVDRPAIKALTLTATPPVGTGATTTHDALAGQHQFLSGTSLALRLVGSVPLSAAEAKTEGAAAPALRQEADAAFAANWMMKDPLTLEFKLRDREYGLESKPVFLSIGLLKDREPKLTVQASGVGRRVTPVARIPVAVRAADDFGLTSLSLDAESVVVQNDKPVAKRHPQPIALAQGPPHQTEFDKNLEVALRSFAPPVGAVVKIKAVATDNCVQGRQKAESRTLAFQVVSPDELFYDILTRQRAERAKFENAVKTAQAQGEILASPAAQDKLPNVIRAHQIIDRDIWQIANRLEATLVEMRLNELGTPTALELLDSKVIQPLRQLQTEQMAELRRQMQFAMVDAAALPTARTTHTDVVETMKRILAQMAQWEGFVDVVNQLKQVITMQEGVLKTTEEMAKQKVKGLFDD